MKKIYKLVSVLVLLALGKNAMAQATTITATALPQVGYVYNMLSDTAHGDRATFTVSAGSSSAQTWNYTPLWTASDSTYAEPTSFVLPSSGSGSSNFPSSNLATLDNTGTWAYFITGSSGLLVDGVYTTIQGTPTAIDFTPNPTQIPVPYTYGSTPVVNNYTATFAVSGITVHHRAMRTITADAFGSITTPSGTYSNTLRLKTHELTSDSAFFGTTFVQAQYDTTTNYNWVQNNQAALVMSMDLDHTGKVTKVSYLQSFSNGVATINQPKASFNLFPNPASDMMYLTYENKTAGMVSLQLIDLTGKQVAVLLNEQQGVGTQQVAVNVSALHLAKGMYFLQLNSNNNLQTKKLTIN